MKFFGVIASLAMATTALAAPGWGDWSGGLTQRDAEDIVAKFSSILTHADIPTANKTAQALIAEGYTEISDSINILAGFPIGGVTFNGKQSYINGVLYSPSLTGIENLKIAPAGNNLVIWYWKFTGIGSKQVPVRGFNLFEINKQKQITSLYVEFNSIAWGIDTGYTTTDPTGKKLPLV
ncbi:hypothetical protein PV10_02709 [Exophiala mesophila]|uniref:NTF2-like domain-containing protein n=1 Tax=Exophiala mesophila TaxID=212818 RepID=A0A0D1WZV1_EXOME|nr:uncharacterized protein PV10_02709 [Exophiala mesophila]KIV95000.1 hypothetical protein PV10_02709 [Exophiala mesophila]